MKIERQQQSIKRHFLKRNYTTKQQSAFPKHCELIIKKKVASNNRQAREYAKQ